MEKSAAGSAHRCTLCAKSYSRRENLVRHYRSARMGPPFAQLNDKNNTPYACSLCPSRFTRSDLLSRHKKAHGNASDASETASGGNSYDLIRNQRVSGNQQNAKRLRQIANNEAADPRVVTAPTNDNPNIPSNQQRGNGCPVSNPEAVPPVLSERTLVLTDQTDVPDWDLQWNFYGEGPQDVNLDWTLDFLSNGVSTHSPLDLIHDHSGSMHTTQLGNAAPNQSLNDNQYYNRVHGTRHEPQECTFEEIRPDSSRTQRPLRETSGPAAYVDIDERNAFIEDKQSRMKCQLSETCHTAMVETVTSPLLESFCSPKCTRPHPFPPHSTITYFIQLYFVHVQPRFPVLHVPTFDFNKSPPNLLLAMAILGSSYSESNQGKFALTYLERARMSIKLTQERDQSHLRSFENLLALFIISLSAMWVGQKAAYERFEVDRGDLAVYCRRSQLLDCRKKRQTSSQASSRHNRNRVEEAWLNWINDEQKKRLGLCIYLLDCQMAAFFHRQPYISKAETVNAALPCSETFWNASTAWAWKALLGPADIPPSTYFLTTLTTILLHNELPDVLPFPPLDDFCKTLYAYVLHTHVFEWRQTICMLNPTGLVSSPLSLAPQNIGNSLQERRDWLEGSLKDWATFYGDGNQADPSNRSPKNSSGILLFHLAILALHLNFSDLHIVAGRSGSDADIGLAEQSLRNWLQEERAQKIFDCSSQMLNAAHEAIAAGDAQRSGFELAICLFMGGLTSWVMSRFGSPDLTLTPRLARATNGMWDGRDQRRDGTDRFSEESSGVRDSLLAQVTCARDGLRALKCLRLAVAFGDILDRLLTEPLQ